MRSLKLLAAIVVATLLFSVQAKAQTSAFYAGKWDVLVKGTPQGDVHLKFALADSASTIKGTYTDPESNKEMPLTKTELKDGKLNLYFTIQQYDLSLALAKKDDDNVTGSLMGMFDAAGVRVK
ncbi:hypothetical protein [Mucilaginibacter sp.]|uniref:hypothetical protein n=1 Tax=Mucilaginibacter sp. TaxID=1882438 RepID=UPI0035BC81AF